MVLQCFWPTDFVWIMQIQISKTLITPPPSFSTIFHRIYAFYHIKMLWFDWSDKWIIMLTLNTQHSVSCQQWVLLLTISDSTLEVIFCLLIIVLISSLSRLKCLLGLKLNFKMWPSPPQLFFRLLGIITHSSIT